MEVTNFYHDKPLTETELYKRSLESFLFPDLVSGEIKRGPITDIHPELARDKDANPNATRLIMVDTATLIVREAFDLDRLSSKLNIDLVLEQFSDTSLSSLLAVQVFDLFEKIGQIDDDEREAGATIEGVDADLQTGLLAIGFNDPLDILAYLTIKNGVRYCEFMAVTPRPTH